MINLLNVAKYYSGLPHQDQALQKLQATLAEVMPELLANDSDWVKLWRTAPDTGLLPNWKGGDRAATIQAIVKECDRQGLSLITQKAYVLATTEWETGNSFQPVREAYWLSEEWRKANFRYYPYYGRGYVQITWDFNYQRYSDLLDLDLLKNPDWVMRPDVSLFILVHGSKHGVFTGRRIEDYIHGTATDYWNARRVINGTDKAGEIASIAKDWENWLRRQ